MAIYKCPHKSPHPVYSMGKATPELFVCQDCGAAIPLGGGVSQGQLFSQYVDPSILNVMGYRGGGTTASTPTFVGQMDEDSPIEDPKPPEPEVVAPKEPDNPEDFPDVPLPITMLDDKVVKTAINRKRAKDARRAKREAEKEAELVEERKQIGMEIAMKQAAMLEDMERLKEKMYGINRARSPDYSSVFRPNENAEPESQVEDTDKRSLWQKFLDLVKTKKVVKA